MQAVRDQNRVTSIICLSTDGVTPIPIMADPITHLMETETNVAPFAAKSTAGRDQNRVTTMIAASSADGTTPVAIYANPVTQAIFLKIV